MYPVGWVQIQKTNPNQWNCAYYGYGYIQGYNHVYGYDTQTQGPKMYSYTPPNANYRQQ